MNTRTLTVSKLAATAIAAGLTLGACGKQDTGAPPPRSNEPATSAPSTTTEPAQPTAPAQPDSGLGTTAPAPGTGEAPVAPTGDTPRDTPTPR